MPRSLFLLLAVLVPAATFAAPVVTGVKSAEWRPIDVWRQPQGLPQNTVMAIRQSRDGYIWIATKGGVTRFDGRRFTTFDDRDERQLQENEVWSLAEGDDGSLWIGTYGGGVSRFQDGQFAVYTSRQGLVNDYVTALCTDPSGAVWIGTDGGVSRFSNKRFTSFTVADGLPHAAVRSLLCESDGSVLIGTTSGQMGRFADGKVRAEPLVGLTAGAEVNAMCRDRGRALWIATDEGVLRVKEGKSTLFTTRQGLSSNATLAVYEDPRGEIWVGGEKGLSLFHPEEFSFRSFGQDVTSVQTVKAIYGDSEGNLWIGGVIDGLVRLRKTLFVNYTANEGLADPYVTAVLEDSRRAVWLGTANGLNRLDGDRLTTYTTSDPHASNRVTALAEDGAGRVWVGTNEGLYRFEAGQLVPLRYEALPLMNVRIIYADRAGALWIGTHYEGIIRYENGRFTRFTTRDGLSHDAVRAIAEGLDGALWIGTKGGLSSFKGGTFTRYTEKDGLANIAVESLYMDREGTLWVATRHGVNRRKRGRFTTFTVNNGLHANFVYCFVEDDRDHFWMNSVKGVFRVRKQELEDFADGKISRVASVAYGVEHGLTSTVGVVSQFPVAYKAQDGRIWFCTLRGASVVDPSNLSSNSFPPPVHIEQITVDDQRFGTMAPVSAPAGVGNIAIRYTGLSFMAPEKVRFKYRLEPHDRDWVDAGERREAYYTNVPPGRYHFRVHAANNDHIWNTEGASIELSVASHFHQTLWFRALAVLVVGLAAIGVHLWRLRALRERERELSSRVQEAVAQVKMLRGMLPICPACKKVRDDHGYWNQIETYIHERSEAEVSHSMCPECLQRLYPGYLATRRTS